MQYIYIYTMQFVWIIESIRIARQNILNLKFEYYAKLFDNIFASNILHDNK